MEVPKWLLQELDILPYHRFIELSEFLEQPDHVQKIEESMGKVIQRDVRQ
jgi:hypothetical protein